MKTYIHARLGDVERGVLRKLRKSTGWTESEILRRGLHLVAREDEQRRSALALAGAAVGKFKKGPKDLSTNRKYLEGFGG